MIGTRELYSAAQVRERIDALVAELRRDYAGRAPLVVVVAEGARRFADALATGLAAAGFAPELREVRARRTQGTALGAVQLDALDPAVFAGRDVLIVDDIADEGRTLEAVGALVRRGAPTSLRMAVLVSKRARRAVELRLDYVGFELADGWVIGFGMDLDGAFRELDHLAVVDPPTSGSG